MYVCLHLCLYLVIPCLSMSGDILSENHVSNHVEPHPGYTRGISVEQTTLNGGRPFFLL